MNKNFLGLALAAVVVGSGPLKPVITRAAEGEAVWSIAEASFVGKWTGHFEVKANDSPQKEAKPFDLELSKVAGKWMAACRFNVNGHDSSNTKAVVVKGDAFSFQCNIGDSEWRFKGKLAAGKLEGTLEILEQEQRVAKGTWSAARPKK